MGLLKNFKCRYLVYDDLSSFCNQRTKLEEEGRNWLKYDKRFYIVEYSIRFYGDFMKQNSDLFPVSVSDKL